MASQIFAATTVVSEALVNRCLATYLANLPHPQDASVTRSFPQTINGVPQTVILSADFAVISAKAALRTNPQNRVAMTFRFYSAATVTASKPSIAGAGPLPAVIGLPLLSFDSEIVLSTTVSAPLVSQVVGDQFQLGVDLSTATVQSVTVDMLTPATIYSSALVAALSDPSVSQALTIAIQQLSAGGVLPVTMTIVPAFYDLTMPRPLVAGQQWFSARVPVSELVVQVRDFKVAAGVNVAPHTAAPALTLSDHISPDGDDRRSLYDVSTIANLQFLEDFLHASVFPLMRNEFIAGGVRLNRVTGFTFKNIGTRRGFRDGLELKLNLTVFSHNFWHFVVAGTTGVDIDVTIHGYPYLQFDRINFEVNDIDVELPAWVSVAEIVLTTVMLPFSLIIPIVVDMLMRNAKADILNASNRNPTSNSLLLSQETTLPDTGGPPYRFALGAISTSAKSFRVEGNFRPPARVTPRLTCAVEEVSTDVPPGHSSYEIRKIGELPGFVITNLYVPPGLVHPRDPSVRVRWTVLLNGNPVPSLTRDVRLSDDNSKELRVIPMLFTKPNRTDQELAVVCRLYRSLGASTEEFLNQRINVLSVDPRPDSLKPYVQWGHWVKYWNGYNRDARYRRSKIHKVPGKGGCKFSNQYLNSGIRGFKFGSIRHLGDLPFDRLALEQNRDLVCPYCFFGGPDKHAFGTSTTIDFASHAIRREP